MYIVLQSLDNRQVSIQSERTIPLGAIKYVSTSSLKDDWFSLGVSSPQEADPLINCVFKTEFFTQLKMATPGGPSLKISEVIEYNKKPGKPSTVKTVKDPSVARDDYYKSGTIHTGPGEPPNSVSKRTPKPKQVAGKPITSGKLLRPGGPGGAPGKLSSRPSSSRPIPQPPSSQRSTAHPRPTPAPPSAVPQPAISKARPVPQPLAAVNGINHSRNDSASSITRAPPPPPPPTAAPPAVQKDTYRALYDFPGQSDIELQVAKDEIIEVVRKEPNGRTLNFNRIHCILLTSYATGWWLTKKLDGSAQGWVPSAYLTAEAAKPTPPPAPPAAPSFPSAPTNGLVANGSSRAIPTARTKPTPPAPPTKRPAGRKPAPPPAPRDSAVSMSSVGAGGSGSGSGRVTPEPSSMAGGGKPSLAGGLAEALRQRQASMQGKKDDDDDW